VLRLADNEVSAPMLTDYEADAARRNHLHDVKDAEGWDAT